MTPEYDVDRSKDTLCALAAEQGCEPVFPGPYDLQLDLDSEEAFQVFRQQYELLVKQNILLGNAVGWRSNGGNRHVVVQMPFRITNVERVALQALLGSDLKREALAYSRVFNGTENPSVLFRPVGATIEQISINEFDVCNDICDDICEEAAS